MRSVQALACAVAAAASLAMTSEALAQQPQLHLSFERQPASHTAGSAFRIDVYVRDGQNKVVRNAPQTVTLALGTNPSGGALLGTVTLQTVNGEAVFRGLSIQKAGQGYTLAASAPGVASAASNAFSVFPGLPAHLAFTVQPTNEALGSAIAPAVQVSVQDAFNNTVPFPLTIKVSLANNPTGATLSGTTQQRELLGTASFADLKLDRVGAGYTLRADTVIV